MEAVDGQRDGYDDRGVPASYGTEVLLQTGKQSCIII